MLECFTGHDHEHGHSHGIVEVVEMGPLMSSSGEKRADNIKRNKKKKNFADFIKSKRQVF